MAEIIDILKTAGDCGIKALHINTHFYSGDHVQHKYSNVYTEDEHIEILVTAASHGMKNLEIGRFHGAKFSEAYKKKLNEIMKDYNMIATIRT